MTDDVGASFMPERGIKPPLKRFRQCDERTDAFEAWYTICVHDCQILLHPK